MSNDRPMKLNWPAILFLIIVHCAALSAFAFPARKLWVALAVAMYFAVGFSTIIGLHRLLSHRSFECPTWLEYLFVSVAAVTGQGSPLLWAANHRIHHAESDQPGDVHSPRRGFWYSHIGWIVDDRSTDPLAWKRLCKDLENDRYYRWLLRYRMVPHVVAVCVVGLALGWAAVPVVFYLPVVLWMHATYLVNSATHWTFGTRAYETGDDSRNVWWVALLALGEGWHNNHHASPRAAHYGFTSRQLDLSYGVLWGMSKLGLVWNLQPRTKVLVPVGGSNDMTQGPGAR
jgi:stearoyl-CoA desaturase (delta-9 desaturase)